ncbi:MAG: hypothetical protein J0L75_16500 [Spirochaetes bacterium]|nr:hypothetical protein [Spirochaetota bacterium]
MNQGLALLQAHDRKESGVLDLAYQADAGVARLLFRELRTRSLSRELDERLARFHPGLRASVRVRALQGALDFLSGLTELVFAESVAVRDHEGGKPVSDHAYFGPFELRALGNGFLSLGIPPSPIPLAIFRNGSPYAMIEGLEWRSLDLEPGTYRLHLGDDEWEIQVD